MVRAEDGIETDATLNDGEFAGVDLADLTQRLDIAEAPAQAALAALTPRSRPFRSMTRLCRARSGSAGNRPAMLERIARGAGAGARARLAQRAAERARSAAAADAARRARRPSDTVALAARASEGAARRNHAQTRGGAGAGRHRQPREAGASGDRPHPRDSRQVVSRAAALHLGGYAPDAAATLGDRATLLDGDDLAIAGWLPKLGCVREATGLLATC